MSTPTRAPTRRAATTPDRSRFGDVPVHPGGPRHSPGRGLLARAAGAAAALAALAVTGPAAAATGAVPEAALEPRVGYAYDVATGELAYRTIHEPRVAGDRLLADYVRYVSPDGELVARKIVDFGKDPLVPAFRMEIVGDGYVKGLERLGGDRIELFNRDGEDAEFERTEMSIPKGLVASAGLTMLINRRFDELKAGETLEFPFVIPSRLRTIDFRVRMVDRREVLGEPAAVIRMEPANAFVRWLVDPIDICYHAETGALLRYVGLSHLSGPERNGKYRVRIDFPPDGAEPVPPEPTATGRDNGRHIRP